MQFIQADRRLLLRIFRPAGAALLLVMFLTFAVAVRASPTEQEYLKLLQDSLVTYGGTADKAMRHVIDQANKNDASDQFNLGTALMRVRHYFAAVEVLTRATELAPRNALAFGYLGFSFYEIENCEKALPALMKGFEADPSNSYYGHFFQLSGLCLTYKKDYAKAEQYCAKARELRPRFPEPLLCLGRAQFNQGKYAEALLTYKEAYGMDFTSLYPPSIREAQSGVLASLAKLNRLSDAGSILTRTSKNSYQSEYVEQMAARAVSELESGKKLRY
ncbi:MAG: tetratricopeptide repeat protein [Pseudomonadota bacterium]